MEADEEEYSPKWFLIALAAVAILVLVGLAAFLAVPLQPKLSGGSVTVAAGVTSIIMPTNAAALNFSPDIATVFLGVNNTIQWTNTDSIDHTVVLCPPGAGVLCPQTAALASSAILTKGDTFTVTLNSTGVYHFYCSIHPSTMRGTIIVEGGAANATSSGTAAQ